MLEKLDIYVDDADRRRELVSELIIIFSNLEKFGAPDFQSQLTELEDDYATTTPFEYLCILASICEECLEFLRPPSIINKDDAKSFKFELLCKQLVVESWKHNASEEHQKRLCDCFDSNGNWRPVVLGDFGEG